jgi:hypothetical protein
LTPRSVLGGMGDSRISGKIESNTEFCKVANLAKSGIVFHRKWPHV